MLSGSILLVSGLIIFNLSSNNTKQIEINTKGDQLAEVVFSNKEITKNKNDKIRKIEDK